ncbi:hypothetical protein V1Y59_08635 [Gordonia sp. PKS22-38]|uniref:Mce-associated membrane protein n=1 Tax=Gordonia prachuapensis TaxID=3115651 RepID=A0ABU7MS56_9ACTN|nr:hypothetical protein [Gordonia sp. PKS22-38]
MTEQDKPTDDSAETEVDETPTAEATPRPRTKAARKSGGSSARPSTDRERDETTAQTDEPGKIPSSEPRQFSLTFTSAGLAKVAAAIIAIVAVVGVALLGWGYYQERQRLDAFDGSKAASEEFVTKLVSTMTKDGVGSMKELLGPLSTGEFRQHLEQQQSDTAEAVEQLNLQDAESAVKSVSVETFDTDTARTAVLMEVSGTSTLAPDGGQSLMLMWLDLRKEDGQWLVSELSGAQAGIGPEQGGGATPPAPEPQPAPAPAPAG